MCEPADAFASRAPEEIGIGRRQDGLARGPVDGIGGRDRADEAEQSFAGRLVRFTGDAVGDGDAIQ